MEPIEMRDIDYILAVEAERNISRAAEKCYVSQPALSKTVRKAEKNMGVTLFDRSSQPLKVTREGEQVLSYLHQMRSLQDTLEQYCESVRSGSRYEINVSASAYYCTYLLPPIVEDFRQSHPDCAVRLLEASNADMRELLSTGMADIGMTAEASLLQTLDSEKLLVEQIVLAVPAEHPINRELEGYALTPDELADNCCACRTPAVPLSRFQDLEFILLRPGNDLYERGREMFDDAGFFPKVAMETEQMLTAYFVAAAGRGATFVRTSLPGYTGGADGKLRFYRIDHPHTSRQVYLVTARGRELTGLKRQFAAFLRDYHAHG